MYVGALWTFLAVRLLLTAATRPLAWRWAVVEHPVGFIAYVCDLRKKLLV